LIVLIFVPVAFLSGYVLGAANVFSGTSWIEPTIALLAAIIAGVALVMAMRSARIDRTISSLAQFDELLQEVYKAEDGTLSDLGFVEQSNLRYMLVIDKLCQGMLTGIYDETLITKRFGYLVEARIVKNAPLVSSTRANAKTDAKNLGLSPPSFPYESILEWSRLRRPELYAKLDL
jgi:hypothetical protein